MAVDKVAWIKVGTDVVVGGAVGAVDQLVQNEDDKRITATPDLGTMSQYGTYLNYGVPILGILATAMGWLRGSMATRVVTSGSQLAGRKIVKQVTKEEPVPTPSWAAWKPAEKKGLEAARARALAEARARAGGRQQVAGPGSEVTIPIIADASIVV